MGTRRSEATILVTLSFVAASTGLLHTGVVAMLPVLPDVFDVSLPTVSWIATTALVLGAVANPIAGRLADTYGPRRIMVILLAGGLVGAFLAAVSPSFGVLLISRVLQGPAVGCVPLAFAVSQQVFSHERFTRAIAVVSSISLAIGTGFGPLIMGGIAQIWGWRMVFVVAGLLVAASLCALIAFVPTTPSVTGSRFDMSGAIGLGIVLTAGLLAISRAPEWGWRSPPTVGLTFFAIVGAIKWWRMQRRTEVPLVDIVALARPSVMVVHCVGVLVGFAVFALYVTTYTLISLPIETGHGLGLGIGVAGLAQLPGSVALLLTGLVLGRGSRGRAGPRMMQSGLGLMGAGFLLLTITHARVLDLVLGTIAIYVGLALAYSTLPVMLRRLVGDSNVASSNAFNALARTVGSASATAIAAAVLGAATVSTSAGSHPANWSFVVIYLGCAIGCSLGVVGIGKYL